MEATPASRAAWRAAGRRPIRRRSPVPQPSTPISEELENTIRKVIAEGRPELWDDLTEAGQHMLTREVAAAFLGAAHEDRDHAANEILDAWYRTWIVRHAPGYQEMLDRAGKSPEELGEPTYTFDQLHDRIGL